MTYESRRMNFSEALVLLKQTCRLQREGWNGKGQFVCMQKPDSCSLMTQPYLYLKNAQGELVPWLPSQGDLFAEDWHLYSN